MSLRAPPAAGRRPGGPRRPGGGRRGHLLGAAVVPLQPGRPDPVSRRPPGLRPLGPGHRRPDDGLGPGRGSGGGPAAPTCSRSSARASSSSGSPRQRRRRVHLRRLRAGRPSKVTTSSSPASVTGPSRRRRAGAARVTSRRRSTTAGGPPVPGAGDHLRPTGTGSSSAQPLDATDGHPPPAAGHRARGHRWPPSLAADRAGDRGWCGSASGRSRRWRVTAEAIADGELDRRVPGRGQPDRGRPPGPGAQRHAGPHPAGLRRARRHRGAAAGLGGPAAPVRGSTPPTSCAPRWPPCRPTPSSTRGAARSAPRTWAG